MFTLDDHDHHVHSGSVHHDAHPRDGVDLLQFAVVEFRRALCEPFVPDNLRKL
jgi:hypothetical protein